MKENEIGMNYSPGDVDDLDKCIRYFYNRRDELESYAKRASAIFAEMYDSNIILMRFLQIKLSMLQIEALIHE